MGFDEIVGESEPLRSALTQIEHVATTGASVLLLGETGTGKELLARAIHQRSPRQHRPLVKVNLAALPSSLIESELFGHVKGAFTGAVANKIGRFQLADGGTLFLDEIGELDPELQTKLLRVLQEGEFERIGSPETCKVDVRIVAATNRDLRHAMETNRFRPDLYYRLAVFPIEVPPLRLRRDDIPLLVWHFITKKQGRLGKTIDSVPANVMQTLIEYDWPGNIRELENVIERAMILTTGKTLSLPEPLKNAPRLPRIDQTTSREKIDRAQILATLEACSLENQRGRQCCRAFRAQAQHASISHESSRDPTSRQGQGLSRWALNSTFAVLRFVMKLKILEKGIKGSRDQSSGTVGFRLCA